MKIVLLLLFVQFRSVRTASAAGSHDADETLSYGSVVLRPGDIINMRDGTFTKALPHLKWGHTGLYLGRDPETGEPSFFDFTTAKQDATPPYYGRILPEREFLRDNAQNHGSFDVFRSKSPIDFSDGRVWTEARRIANSERYGINDVCSSAVDKILRTGVRHGTPLFVTPNDFLDGGYIEMVPHGHMAFKSALMEAAALRPDKQDPLQIPAAPDNPYWSTFPDAHAITQNAQNTFSEQERLRRAEDESRRKQALLQKSADDRKTFGQSLGFAERCSPDGVYCSGFDDQMTHSADFRYRAGTRLNDQQAEVALGLARSCLDWLYGGGGGVMRGSGMASGLMSDHWNDADFKTGLIAALGDSWNGGIASSGNQANDCVSFVLKNWKAPGDMSKLQDALKDFHKVLEKRQQERRQREEQEARARAPRPQPHNPDPPSRRGGSCGAGYYWDRTDETCYERQAPEPCAVNPDTGVRGCPR